MHRAFYPFFCSPCPNDHQKFGQTILHFKFYWHQRQSGVTTYLHCTGYVNGILPLMPYWRLLSSQLLHLASLQLPLQCNQQTFLVAVSLLRWYFDRIYHNQYTSYPSFWHIQILCFWHNLIPYRKYFNHTHSDIFIHGPFKFATINHRKSWDRISQSNWNILKSNCDLFHNPFPSFNVPTYSVHVVAGTHTSFFCATLSSALASLTHRHIPPVTSHHWQNVSGISPSWIFFFLTHKFRAPFGCDLWHLCNSMKTS